MPRTGRPKSIDDLVDRHISIPRQIADAVDRQHWNDVYNRAEYGAFSKLVSQLLAEWLSKRRSTADTALKSI